MSTREDVLGFKPQKEVPYNKFLPYQDVLDVEATVQLSEIKTNLGRTILLRDIKVGASHWVGQLSRYIRLYGHRYSKEDHLNFIHLLFQLVTLEDLDFSLVYKFAQLYITLLKKKDLISRDELTLPWRPLYRLVEAVVYSPYEHLGLQLLPSNIENVLKSVVRVSRVYFPVESTQEMLDEWRPLLCPFDITMMKGMYYFELFLPTVSDPEHYDKTFRLWFDEFMGLWDTCQNNPTWETNLVNLFARIAVNCTGHVDWNPYIPKIFTRVLRSFNLPVGTNHIQVGRSNNNYDVTNVSWWIICMLGGNSTCQEHINKLFKAIESFYHPSNFGKWHSKLMKLMFRFPHTVVKRIHRERHIKDSWEPKTPEDKKLTDEDVTIFVESIKPLVYTAMFNKIGSHESAATLQQLAVLRPELVIPPLLEKTYPALETLTEPHRLIACLNCTVSTARSMLGSPKFYPDGRTHVLPLLNLCLPGIDPNDIKKCLTTFQLISTLASLVPIADCSEALHVRNDLTDIEKELCAASAQFEDFVLAFLDKVFVLIENSSSEVTRSDSSGLDKLNHEEIMLEVGLLSTFNAIMQQSSPQIYECALKRLYRFVSGNVYEVKVAGRFTADLCRAAAKVDAEKALKMFILYFCANIKFKAANEDLSKEERLDNEFLWNLKLLSEIVRCNGLYLLPYKLELISVLKCTLNLKCKEGADLAGNLLRHTLKAITLIYALDYKSCSGGWERDVKEHLLIRDWGKKGDLDDLQMKWHVPSEKEKEFAVELLETFLLPELEKIKSHVAGETMPRESLLQCLGIISHCISGAGSMLPLWGGDAVPLIESLVDLKRYKNTCSNDESGITLEGWNVRLLIYATVRPLLEHMLAKSEDDTKSLIQIIKLYNSLMFYHGAIKEDFDGRWKSLHLVKKSMENMLIGKKSHIRALLVDRVQLQHELRVINRHEKVFTEKHKDIFYDLLKLSISRYSEVRKQAQNLLNHGCYLFAYSYRAILDDILKYLVNDPTVEHHQFKGALYLIRGEVKRSLVTKRSWEVMSKVWPAVVKAQHSEKPSITRLIDEIADKLQKNVETTELKIETSKSLLEAGEKLVVSQRPDKTEMDRGLAEEKDRNDQALRSYENLVVSLVELIEKGNLIWKFSQLAMEMLSLLVRHDVQLPAPAVRLFVKNMVNDSIQVRKISITSVSGILKIQKRKHKMRSISVTLYDGDQKVNGHTNNIRPGDRPDNKWLQYDSRQTLTTKEKWDGACFVEKTHYGYYTWPDPMKVYAPYDEQPKLGRTLKELREEERPIFEYFTDKEFVEKFVDYMSLEENKGRDKFHPQIFTLFKGLFRNFDDTFVPLLKPHLERLVSDTGHNTHESNQRLAAEIIAGLIRGCKHWPFEKVEAMWKWLIPMLKTALTCMTVESIGDWGTCFATSTESRDPRKLVQLFELLLDNPLRGEGGSFGDSSRLYVLQGALAQQEWRVAEILQRLVDYIMPHLTHPYKNVRDRLGSVLVNIFLYDLKLPRGTESLSPKRKDFIEAIIPHLQILMETADCGSPIDHAARLDDASSSSIVEPMEVDSKSTKSYNSSAVRSVRTNSNQSAKTDGMEMEELGGDTANASSNKGNNNTNNESEPENGESEERKTAVKLCKTMLKWLQGNFSRMFYCAPPEVIQLLPMLCVLESETKDDELKHECAISLACFAQALLSTESIPCVIDTINQVSNLTSWHARSAILAYTQVMVFCNLFTMQEETTIERIKQMVLTLICDEQLEVRELAAVTLGGFLHCGYMQIDKDLIAHFEKLVSTRIRNKKTNALKPIALIKRHAGVLGLSSCVKAFPYDVPTFIPQILMDLSSHVDDPQPIQGTVKKALSEFKRTHHDNWQDHKQQFTDDQLVVLTDVLVSPNYYA